MDGPLLVCPGTTGASVFLWILVDVICNGSRRYIRLTIAYIFNNFKYVVEKNLHW